ncbi:MAG: hypothetical protein K8R88_00725, partial [Armatimonadetes bacterium]|nr:hypothetical protein [Armatimonadota bacterium]
IHTARTAANRTIKQAEGDAAKALFEATGYKIQRTVVSQAEAKRFLIQSESAAKSPRVFRANLYLSTLADSLADVRKYIVPASSSNEVIQINFEERLQRELFDLAPSVQKN